MLSALIAQQRKHWHICDTVFASVNASRHDFRTRGSLRGQQTVHQTDKKKNVGKNSDLSIKMHSVNVASAGSEINVSMSKWGPLIEVVCSN